MFLETTVVLLLGGYLMGSLSFAVIVSRVMGLDDPRTYGSQNPGATNVLRSGNKQAAMATLLFDALKGYLPVLLVKWYGPSFGLDDRAVALVAISAFIGHLWPVFFAFKGGKGVATLCGMLLSINYIAAFSFLADAGGWQRWFFTGLGVVAALVMVYLLRMHAGQPGVWCNQAAR